jgi:hypothetical protein
MKSLFSSFKRLFHVCNDTLLIIKTSFDAKLTLTLKLKQIVVVGG